MLELAQAVTPYVFAGAGIYAVWSAIESVRGHLVTIQNLLHSQLLLQHRIHDAPSLAFEYVTCGGCGESVKTGEDGFTPAPHDCQYEKYSMHSN